MAAAADTMVQAVGAVGVSSALRDKAAKDDRTDALAAKRKAYAVAVASAVQVWTHGFLVVVAEADGEVIGSISLVPAGNDAGRLERFRVAPVREIYCGLAAVDKLR